MFQRAMLLPVILFWIATAEAKSESATFLAPVETSSTEDANLWSPEQRAHHDSLRSNLDIYFQRLVHLGFSGSVLLAQGEKLIFTNAYGLADREQERAFLPSTVLTIGSITKPFTAAAILKIQEMSRLQVHDSSVDLIDTPHRNWNTSVTLIPVRQL